MVMMMMINRWIHHLQGFLPSDANCFCPIEIFLFVCTAEIYLYARLNHILISLFTESNFSQACQQSALWWEVTSRRMNKWSTDHFPIFYFFLIFSNMQIVFVQLRYSYLISLFGDWNLSKAFQRSDKRLYVTSRRMNEAINGSISNFPFIPDLVDCV